MASCGRLGHGASRGIEIDCVCSLRVTCDERCLLDVLALYQRGRTMEALFALRAMLSSGAAVAAGECALQVAQALTAAGRILSLGELPTTRYAFAAASDAVEEKDPRPTIH